MAKKAKEGSPEQKLRALFDLQIIDSKIDDIRTVRGELPLEVEDLEDEIAGLNTRVEKIQTEIDNIGNNPGTGDVSKESHYHTSHTDFMYQRNTTNNDNRRQFVIQNHYFTFQRKGNNELAIQALNILVADLQTQINNLSSNNPPPDDSGIGTAWDLINYFN